MQSASSSSTTVHHGSSDRRHRDDDRRHRDDVRRRHSHRSHSRHHERDRSMSPEVFSSAPALPQAMPSLPDPLEHSQRSSSHKRHRDERSSSHRHERDHHRHHHRSSGSHSHDLPPAPTSLPPSAPAANPPSVEIDKFSQSSRPRSRSRSRGRSVTRSRSRSRASRRPSSRDHRRHRHHRRDRRGRSRSDRHRRHRSSRSAAAAAAALSAAAAVAADVGTAPQHDSGSDSGSESQSDQSRSDSNSDSRSESDASSMSDDSELSYSSESGSESSESSTSSESDSDRHRRRSRHRPRRHRRRSSRHHDRHRDRRDRHRSRSRSRHHSSRHDHRSRSRHRDDHRRARSHSRVRFGDNEVRQISVRSSSSASSGIIDLVQHEEHESVSLDVPPIRLPAPVAPLPTKELVAPQPIAPASGPSTPSKEACVVRPPSSVEHVRNTAAPRDVPAAPPVAAKAHEVRPPTAFTSPSQVRRAAEPHVPISIAASVTPKPVEQHHAVTPAPASSQTFATPSSSQTFATPSSSQLQMSQTTAESASNTGNTRKRVMSEALKLSEAVAHILAPHHQSGTRIRNRNQFLGDPVPHKSSRVSISPSPAPPEADERDASPSPLEVIPPIPKRRRGSASTFAQPHSENDVQDEDYQEPPPPPPVVTPRAPVGKSSAGKGSGGAGKGSGGAGKVGRGKTTPTSAESSQSAITTSALSSKSKSWSVQRPSWQESQFILDRREEQPHMCIMWSPILAHKRTPRVHLSDLKKNLQIARTAYYEQEDIAAIEEQSSRRSSFYRSDDISPPRHTSSALSNSNSSVSSQIDRSLVAPPPYIALRRSLPFSWPLDAFVRRPTNPQRLGTNDPFVTDTDAGDDEQIGNEVHNCVCKPTVPLGLPVSAASSTVFRDENKCCSLLSHCKNREQHVECMPRYCAGGLGCENRDFSSQNFRRMRLAQCEPAPGAARSKGFGVFAEESIEGGQFVVEFVGEIISQAECMRRQRQEYADERHCFMMHIGDRVVFDATLMGNISRFVNHSCQPNCEIQTWWVNGEHRIALYARRRVVVGEELTFDYLQHPYLYGLQEEVRCQCGTRFCRGTLGPSRKRGHLPGDQNSSTGSNNRDSVSGGDLSDALPEQFADDIECADSPEKSDRLLSHGDEDSSEEHEDDHSEVPDLLDCNMRKGGKGGGKLPLFYCPSGNMSSYASPTSLGRVDPTVSLLGGSPDGGDALPRSISQFAFWQAAANAPPPLSVPLSTLSVSETAPLVTRGRGGSPITRTNALGFPLLGYQFTAALGHDELHTAPPSMLAAHSVQTHSLGRTPVLLDRNARCMIAQRQRQMLDLFHDEERVRLALGKLVDRRGGWAPGGVLNEAERRHEPAKVARQQPSLPLVAPQRQRTSVVPEPPITLPAALPMTPQVPPSIHALFHEEDSFIGSSFLPTEAQRGDVGMFVPRFDLDPLHSDMLPPLGCHPSPMLRMTNTLFSPPPVGPSPALLALTGDHAVSLSGSSVSSDRRHETPPPPLQLSPSTHSGHPSPATFALNHGTLGHSTLDHTTLGHNVMNQQHRFEPLMQGGTKETVRTHMSSNMLPDLNHIQH